jgi:hypothetical protein
VETRVVFRRQESFREEVGELPFGWNIDDFEGSSLEMISDKVVPPEYEIAGLEVAVDPPFRTIQPGFAP